MIYSGHLRGGGPHTLVLLLGAQSLGILPRRGLGLLGFCLWACFFRAGSPPGSSGLEGRLRPRSQGLFLGGWLETSEVSRGPTLGIARPYEGKIS